MIHYKILMLMLPLLTGSECIAQSQNNGAGDLFDSDEVLNINLSGDIKSLTSDRTEDMDYHDLRLSYEANGSLISIPLKVKTRGHFRRTMGNCQYPPLLLNFTKKDPPENSTFSGQNKLKLVTPCKDERYVVQEYLVYKLYNFITPKSFKARLVKVIYEDTVKQKKSDPLFGIILEDDDQMAERNNCTIVKDKIVRPEQTNTENFLKMAVFEFMIGNTDWSVQYTQNVKLIATDSIIPPYPVPYDFDMSGIVGTPYSKPAAELHLSSTRERRYRGYCMQDMSSFGDTFSLFNQLKEDFYKTYQDCPWISQSYLKSTVKYLDDFYQTINDEKSARSAFTYPCDEKGTGNVVIRGLK
jgi:hypothetical protein